MRPTRVLILHNQPVLPVGHTDYESEHEIVSTVEVVHQTLSDAGFEAACLGVSTNPQVLLHGLEQHQPDVVFNLFEGTGDHGNTEAYVAGLLDWLGMPFTGSPFHALTLARSKHLTKYLFQGAGLPTPAFFIVEALPVLECPLEWPVIVKPAQQDASVGLDQGSVVTDLERLQERVAGLLRNYGPPVLVEQFIPGRELNVAVVEAPDLRLLPISEVLFVDKEPGYWPIVTYDAKWRPGTRDYEATPPRYPADVTPRLAERLGALARPGFSTARLPGLCPGRFPGPPLGQTLPARGQSQPRLQSGGRPGGWTDFRRPDPRPVHRGPGAGRPGPRAQDQQRPRLSGRCPHLNRIPPNTSRQDPLGDDFLGGRRAQTLDGSQILEDRPAQVATVDRQQVLAGARFAALDG